jgi:hypothetical protein
VVFGGRDAMDLKESDPILSMHFLEPIFDLRSWKGSIERFGERS